MSVYYIYICAVLFVRTEFVLRVSDEGTTCMSMCCANNAGKYRNMKLANKSFENMANFKYLGKILKNSKFYVRRK